MNTFDRRGFLATTAGAALMAAGGARAQGAAGAPAKLTALLDKFFAENLAESPELATSLGLDTGAQAAAKSKLHDASISGLERRRGLSAYQLGRLRALDRKALNGAAAVNYDTVLADLTATAEGDARFVYGGQGAGAPYVLSQINGAWQDTPDFLTSQHAVETREDAEAYVTRLEAFGRVMDEELERVRRDVGLGVIPPDFAIDGALAGMKLLRTPAETSSLVTHLAERTRAKGIAGDWAVRAGEAYTAKVLPALDRQMAMLSDLRGRAVHDAGVWRLPDGEEYYTQALAASTTSTLSPAEVHQLGLDVTRELSARADVLFRKLGMTKGTVGERYDGLYKSKRGVYPNTDAGKARLIADLNKEVAAMQVRLPSYFGTLPKAPVEIRRIPAATEGGASTHYSNPSLDGSRPGIYWLNLRDTAESPYWFLPTTSFHEAVPGHHLQISMQQEADLPMLRRAGGFTAYSEGWALYSEQLVQEMGVYQKSPLNELGYIHDALLRSGRLVVDTGLHSLRWSREKAIETLSGINGDPPSLSAQEIERYCVTPGQACSYMVGKVTIVRLREKAKAALGPRFDIRKFHDAVLLSGALPLTVLETVVDDWVAAQT
jgi:uncharacterized protein (DUF885 family)